MIILIGAQKGGCGKSTLAVNLAAEFKRLGSDVCLVDADSQMTTTNWALERLESDKEDISYVRLSDNVNKPLKDLASRYELVIVDVAGRDSRELRTAMLAADIMLTPFRPSQPDLDTLPTLLELTESSKDINEKLKCLAVLTMAPTNVNVNEINEARESIAEYPEFTLCKTVIKDRKAYRDSISYGAGVVEWTNTKAAAEVQLLAQEIITYAKA